MGNFEAAATATHGIGKAVKAERYASRARAFRAPEEPRPGRHGIAEWAPVLAMVGAGVTFVLYIMTTINASMADNLVGVTHSIEELDKRVNLRMDEMDKRVAVQLDGMGKRLERLETRADRTDERLNSVEARLTSMDAKLDRVLEHVARRR